MKRNLQKVLGASLVLGGVAWFASQSGNTPSEHAAHNDAVATSPTSIQVTPSDVDTARIPASDTKKIKKTKSVTFKQLKRFNELKDCLKTSDCNFDDSDPRAYEINVGEAMRKLVATTLKGLKNGDVQLSEEEITELFEQAIHIPNGHVQAAALELQDYLPLNEQNLNRLLTGLDISNYDSVLFAKSLDYLLEYRKNYFVTEIDDFLKKHIETGAHYTSQYLSESILPFLSSDNIAQYEEMVQKMDPKEHRTSQLKIAIDEYKRMLSQS
jgi:hypothetical protein